MNLVAKKTSRLASVDIAKFVLSIMVVAIHVSPVSKEVRSYLLPILRLAVPIFFMLSSYFLFLKIESKTCNNPRAVLLKYVKRQSLLYFFWLIVLFVPTLLYRADTYTAWFSEGVVKGVLLYLASIVFSSTFKVSWFLAAGIVAATILFFIPKNRILYFAIPIACFAVSCLASNYYGMLPDCLTTLIRSLFRFGNPYNSFPVALFWMMVGREVAIYQLNNKFELDNHTSWQLYSIIILGLFALYTERAIISFADVAKTDDCYFSLPMIAIPLFILILKANTAELPEGLLNFMRSTSTITYCLHATVAFLMTSYLDLNLTNLSTFILVLLLCWITTGIIMFGEKHGITILKYSH